LIASPRHTFAFDREHGRLYGGSRAGLYWVGLAEDRPIWKGPVFKKDLIHIEFAPDLGRVFYASRETVGFVTPAYLEADPAGGHVFAAYDRNLVAIDAATGTVAGRADFPSTPAIAFDPGSNTLIATWADEPTPVHVASFRVDGGALARVEEFDNPTAGRVGVEPTNNGFIQSGVNRLYLWTAK
jgi:hypothetical protein